MWSAPPGGESPIRIASTFPSLVTGFASLLCVAAIVGTTVAYRLKEKRTRPLLVPSLYQAVYEGGIRVDEVSSVRDSFPFDSIVLERTGCFGDCPVYAVALRKSGLAELSALSHLSLDGEYIGEVDVFSYGRLCYLIECLGFFGFEDDYAAGWTCDSTCFVTVSGPGGTKTVSDYGDVGPIELWAIQQSIDNIRQGIEWRSR